MLEDRTALVLARLAFPGCESEDSFSPPDYMAIVNLIGKPLVRTGDGSYQGTMFVLLAANGSHGFLKFGWGSCSGCDALQSCDSYKSLGDLMSNLMRSVEWFDTLAGAQAYIAGLGDEPQGWYLDGEGFKTFRAEVAALQPA